MILNDRDIIRGIDLGWLICKKKSPTFGLAQVNPNSIDLTIGSEVMKPRMNDGAVVYGMRNPGYEQNYWYRVVDEDFIRLRPGEVLLACTREWIRMPNDCCGQLFTKSSLGRLFINHMMAGVIDAGFSGRLTLELKNDGPHEVVIKTGSPVVQMVISVLTGAASRPYGDKRRKSKYQKSERVECSR